MFLLMPRRESDHLASSSDRGSERPVNDELK